jgi:hypothetical protein
MVFDIKKTFLQGTSENKRTLSKAVLRKPV